MPALNSVANPLRKRPVPFGGLLGAGIVVFELLFECLTGAQLSPAGLCFSGCLGLLLGALLELLPGKALKRWALALAGTAAAVMYLTEFYVLDAFGVYMTPAMILRSAGGVMADYSAVTLGLLLREVGFLLLVLLPLPLCAFLLEPIMKPLKAGTAAAALALCLAGAGVWAAKDSGFLETGYDFEGGVQALGLPAGIIRDQITGLSQPSLLMTAVDYTEPAPAAHSPENTAGDKTAEVSGSDTAAVPAGAVTAPSAEVRSETQSVVPAELPPEETAGSDLPKEQPSAETPTEELPSIEAQAENLPPDDDPAEEGPADISGAASEEPGESAAAEEDMSSPVDEAGSENDCGLNVLAIDYEELRKNDTLRSITDYILSRQASEKNEYTGLFEGKNLILITAEAFSAEVIDENRTPALWRLANQGIRFTDYYQPAWGGSTTGGEMANLFGLVPDISGGMEQIASQYPFITIGSRLNEEGYTSMAFHNNTGTFYGRIDTHAKLGYDEFITPDQGMAVEGCWPQSDLEMMIDTIPRYIDQQPFSVYYMTVSGHSVYTQEGNAQARKNIASVQDLAVSEPVRCYLAANMELEYAMEELLAWLEAEGIADDTVIVLTTDHYPYGLEKSRTWGSEDCLAELYGTEPGEAMDVFTRDHSALIIWSGCLEGKNIRVDSPTSSLDILPTLCNLFGVEYESRMFPGRDVFSDAEALVLWPNGSWITEYGSYLAAGKILTMKEDAEPEAGYADRITEDVKERINASYAIQRTGYLKYMAALRDQ